MRIRIRIRICNPVIDNRSCFVSIDYCNFSIVFVLLLSLFLADLSFFLSLKSFGPASFLINFNDTILREEYKTKTKNNDLRITGMAKFNQSELPAFFIHRHFSFTGQSIKISATAFFPTQQSLKMTC
jgi:hypothetical protein